MFKLAITLLIKTANYTLNLNAQKTSKQNAITKQ
ncbi:hypothetical protein BH11CYA1_BH11CYA1_49430 [soil metagenome]